MQAFVVSKQYNIDAPLVAIETVTFCEDEYEPPAGENVGAATVSVYVVELGLLSVRPDPPAITCRFVPVDVMLMEPETTVPVMQPVTPFVAGVVPLVV